MITNCTFFLHQLLDMDVLFLTHDAQSYNHDAQCISLVYKLGQNYLFLKDALVWGSG